MTGREVELNAAITKLTAEIRQLEDQISMRALREKLNRLTHERAALLQELGDIELQRERERHVHA